MNNRGQAAIEFIMLVLIVLIYLLTITRPLINDAKGLTEDVQTVIRADTESKRIASSIVEVATLGQGSRRTIELSIPLNSIIFCDDAKNAVGFGAKITTKPYPILNSRDGSCNGDSCCYGGDCNKFYAFPPGDVDLVCNSESIIGSPTVIILNEGVASGTATVSIIG